MSDRFSDFFSDDVSVLRDVENASVIKNFRKGAMIVAEGDSSSTVFYILAGEATALRYSVAGAEVFLDTFGPGELIGEMAALDGGERSADIYALSDITLAIFPGQSFIHLMEKHGSIGVRVSQLLVRRIHKTTRRMFEQSTLSSKGRVYAELMRLAVPVNDDGMLRIASLPSISEIAKKLGIARETVSRTVNGLKDDGIVQSEGADLMIIRPHDLVERLN